MSRALPAVAMAAVLIACAVLAGLHFSNGNGGGPTDPSDPSMFYTDLPDGIAADDSDCVFRASEEISWKVRDRFHTYYDTDAHGSFTALYEGTETVGKELRLEPGMYSVAAGGGSFEAIVYGNLAVSASWKYDMDGIVVDASVSYSMSVSELAAEWDFADDFNTRGSPAGASSSELAYRFSDLPQLVRAGDSVRSAADGIRAEYLRLGGDPGDGQSFLDFIAGFVQKAVKYPPSVPGHSGEYDYGTYGKSEYWAVPAQTLRLLYGDCEDDSALFCALASCFGYDTAMAGKAGHVFAGVVVDGFREADPSRLASLGIGYMEHISHTDVCGTSGKVFQAVELIKGQAPVGYCMPVSFGSGTFWGITGFYPVGRARCRFRAPRCYNLRPYSPLEGRAAAGRLCRGGSTEMICPRCGSPMEPGTVCPVCGGDSFPGRPGATRGKGGGGLEAGGGEELRTITIRWKLVFFAFFIILASVLAYMFFKDYPGDTGEDVRTDGDFTLYGGMAADDILASRASLSYAGNGEDVCWEYKPLSATYLVKTDQGYYDVRGYADCRGKALALPGPGNYEIRLSVDGSRHSEGTAVLGGDVTGAWK